MRVGCHRCLALASPYPNSATQEAKAENRKRLAAKYANAGAFKLRILERPSSLETIRAEIQADLERQLTFKPPKAKPVPQPSTTQVRCMPLR
jgi:hypothetical protein